MTTNAEFQGVLEQLGNPADVDRGIRNFRRAASILSSKQPRMIDEYPKQWIAVYQGKVRVRARTFQSLLVQVDEKGLPRGHTIIRFIDRNQRTMIL
jgi:hypothetical protein